MGEANALPPKQTRKHLGAAFSPLDKVSLESEVVRRPKVERESRGPKGSILCTRNQGKRSTSLARSDPSEQCNTAQCISTQ